MLRGDYHVKYFVDASFERGLIEDNVSWKTFIRMKTDRKLCHLTEIARHTWLTFPYDEGLRRINEIQNHYSYIVLYINFQWTLVVHFYRSRLKSFQIAITLVEYFTTKLQCPPTESHK